MKLKTLGVASAIAITASLAAPAYAQQTASTTVTQNGNSSTSTATSTGTADEQLQQQQQEADRTNVITVTAEFRNANLQDTPIAITAVNAAMLEARGQTDITQVAAQAPNVSLRAQPQNGGSGLIAFIRGVGQTDFDYAVDPGVGVYIDDVYIPTLSSSLLELIDLDRVEILRGPQGTLAGKNSIGGAIKLFTAKPKGNGTGSFTAEYGSYNQITVRGMADFALSPTLAVRVSGMTNSHDGYVAMLDYGQTHPNSNVPENNARGGNADYSMMGGQNIAAIRGALRWTPTSRLEVNVSGDYTRETSEAIPTVVIAAGRPSGNFVPSNGTAATAGLATNTVGVPLLVGKNGAPVPVDCHFVPAGRYSCDTGGNLLGYDPRFVSYSNFMDASAPSPMAPFKPYFSLPITTFNGWGVQGNLQYDLSDAIQLVYIGSYRAYESKFGQDQDATPVAVAQLDNQLNHHAFSSEVRLNFKGGHGLFEGTLGGYYLSQEGIYTARVDLNYVNPVIDFLHGPDTTPSKTKAVFGTVTIHPTEALSITGGLRYTWDQKDYTYFRRNPDGTLPNAGICFAGGPPFPGFVQTSNCLLAGIYNITGSFRGERLDYRGVLNYRFSNAFMAYASISTGFKGGGVNPRPFVADQRLAFNPETLTTYEVGFKTDLFDRRLRLNGAGFWNKYNDIQIAKLVCPESSLPSPCLRPDNIGTADVKGLELEASVYPAHGLSFDGSISYLDFKYTSPTSGGFLVNTAIPAGGITPYTPKLNYSIGGQYDYETSRGTFSIRLDGNYQGKLYTAAENTPWSLIPGRFLANGRISWTTRDDEWQLYAEVKNLTDKYYFTSVSDASSSLGVVTGVPGLPRTWLVGVKRKFGPIHHEAPPAYVPPPPPPPPAAPVATYKQCLDGSVVPMDAACPPPPVPPAPVVPRAGERG